MCPYALRLSFFICTRKHLSLSFKNFLRIKETIIEKASNDVVSDDGDDDHCHFFIPSYAPNTKLNNFIFPQILRYNYRCSAIQETLLEIFHDLFEVTHLL